VTPEQFVSKIEQDQLSPVYLLIGEEFQRDEALSLLLDKILGPSARDFNLDVFHADEVDPGHVLQAACSLPLMGTRRVVVLKECNRFPEETLGALVDSVSKPKSSTIAILTAQKVKLTKGGVFKKLQKAGYVVEFRPLYQNQIPGWIRRQVMKKGKRISSDATYLLLESCGTDLRSLANEIDKLLVFVGERPCITLDDVGAVVGTSKLNNVFELTDAIGRRQKGKALSVLDRMLETGEGATRIIMAIARHLRIMLKLKELQKTTSSREELIEKTKVHPYFFNEFLAQASNFSVEALKHGLNTLLEADNRLKSRSTNQRILMELLVWKLLMSFNPDSGN